MGTASGTTAKSMKGTPVTSTLSGKRRPPSAFPWDKYLTMGAYGIWDLCEEEAHYNLEVLPPIGYKDGEAL